MRSLLLQLHFGLTCLLFSVSVSGFTTCCWSRECRLRTRLEASTIRRERDSPVTADVPTQFQPLFQSIVNATAIRGADTSNQGHDSFRYEWGTWAVDENLAYLMHMVDRVRLKRGAYDTLLSTTGSKTSKVSDEASKVEPEQSIRLEVAGGIDWDCILHVLPPDSDWQGRWPTGSWSIVKALTGQAEMATVTGREGNYRKRVTKKLRGGSDGSLAGGQSSAGDDCVKYVGGPLRSYGGMYGKTVVLEVVVRPPISAIDENQKRDANGESIEQLENIEDILSITEEALEVVQDEEEDKAQTLDSKNATHLGAKLGMTFDQVGGLDKQLDAIARRVLASRANPAAARRLGVSHVRGVLLSGPPGCGKTLLARELSRILGAREPQIVNGPEILDKYIGEAEKRVRDLFRPAEEEYKAAGDDSALHIIILDEMDAIARKRGTMTSDTTGVRDSVVNQLLAKMDGVREASNVLVVGLTNRPELLDPALLRPGRLEVQLRIELPDQVGRRDILRIHTRQMREAGGLSEDAAALLEDYGDIGIAARTDHFSGAELAGLVRSAASFALGRTLDGGDNAEMGIITVDDLEQALKEVRPALGKQDDVLRERFPLGISTFSPAMERVQRDLQRFIAPIPSSTPRLQSLLLVGEARSGGSGGTGVTALAAWAAAKASIEEKTDYVRFVTALDLLTGGGASGDEARAAALLERFVEAKEMPHSLLVLDDIDQLCAGTGPSGYSSVVIATLRALLRSPPASTSSAKAGGHSDSKSKRRLLNVIATTSRSDAACSVLHELFDETIVLPVLDDASAVEKLIRDSLEGPIEVADPKEMGVVIIEKLGSVACKTALRLVERSVASGGTKKHSQLTALKEILDDLEGDGQFAQQLCEVL